MFACGIITSQHETIQRLQHGEYSPEGKENWRTFGGRGESWGLWGLGGISQQPDRESLGQRAPKSSNGLESLTALGFILSMAPRC